MLKIIFKYWTINLLISLALFVLYRVVMSHTYYSEKMNFYEKFFFFLEAITGLFYSALYLNVILWSSLLFYLNLIKKVRDNYFWSCITFVGLPFAVVGYLIIAILISKITIPSFITLLVFSILYQIITAIEFINFRKRISAFNFPDTLYKSNING
jgi:hypothetical protein